MADPTMMGAADPLAGAGDASGAPAPDDMSGGFTIKINVDAQGGITVGVEAAGEESGEEQGAQGADVDAEQPDDGAQPVPSLKEALRLIADIYNNKGQMTPAGAPGAEQSAAADAFSAARGK